MKHDRPDPASRDDMTDDHAEKLLAEALEDYHRRRARGERPDEAAYREQLEDLYPLFVELIAAETIIDLALEPAGDETELPLAWGAYTLLREIARGAAGVVYEAIHRKLGRKVALKVLRTGVDTDKVARERFHREAQALAHVKHDNIVEIYEFGEIDGRPFYAMSLVNGPSLKELIKQGKAPEPRELCRGLAGVADALAMLHGEGIIHRDVKPQNIMVDADGRYMLADFGLARSSLAETMTQSGDALGTPLYMSPEQILADRKAIDARSDIYGLGATLYEMLAHVPPFKTDNLQALMRMILQERPVSPRTVRPDLPKNSAGIALGCLEKKPEDRPQTAEALRDALLAVAEDERVRTAIEPVSRPKRGLRLALDHPILTAAALVLVAVGVWFAVRPPDPARVDFTVFPYTAVARIQGVEGELVPDATGAIQTHLPPDRAYTVEFDPRSPHFEKGTHQFKLTRSGYVKVIYLPDDDTTEAELILDRQRQGMAPIKFGEQEVHRGRDDPRMIDPIYPLGRTDVASLGPWMVLIHDSFVEAYPSGAWLSWKANGALLHSERFPSPETTETAGRLPAAVVERLEPGMTVTWGIAEAEGADPVAEHARTFSVVDAGIGAERARVAKASEPRDDDGPNVDRSQIGRILSAELYLNRGLPAAAFEVLYPVVLEDFARLVAELEAADAEGRPDRPVAFRTTPHMLALMEKALDAQFERRSERDESLAWAELKRAWGEFFGEDGRNTFYGIGSREDGK